MSEQNKATTVEKAVDVECQTSASLEHFLRNKAKGAILEKHFPPPIIVYREDANDDALTGAWLDNETSYIWKVGVLSVVDGNKRDWGYLFIGHHRKPNYPFEFIGELCWGNGEKDDPGQCLERYLKCAKNADILFER